jgi:hypothetical protein
LPQDIFGFLGLAPRFALEDSELERRQRELAVERQVEGPRALEKLNEAVRALKDPATRAEQLFELRGWSIKGSPDPILLERIFTDREFIDLARKKGDKAGLDAWMAAALPRQKHLIDLLTLLLDGPAATTYPTEDAPKNSSDAPSDRSDAQRALLLLEELRFFSRAVAAARAAIDAFEDAAADEPEA